MLSFCTFTLQSLQCYHIFIIFSVMWTHVRIRFRAQAQHGHENIPETCEVALMWPWSLEKVKGIIFHATCTDFLIFDRVWPSKVSKRIIRPCHFISTCGASSSSISMLHFSKKLILSDSNSLVQEPEMQVTTATLGQHKNTFILRQIRFQWCSMYLCICSFWRYWVKNQCDETFNVTTLMTHTHTQKDYIQYCMRPFDYGIFCAHTKCFAALPRHEPPLWSSTAAGLLRLTGMVEVRPTVARSLPTDRRIRKIDNPKAFNELQHNFLKQSATVKMRRQRTYWKSLPFTQIQLIRCCETIGWIWVQRRVDTLLSDGACWNGSCLPSCRKRNSTCL